MNQLKIIYLSIRLQPYLYKLEIIILILYPLIFLLYWTLQSTTLYLLLFLMLPLLVIRRVLTYYASHKRTYYVDYLTLASPLMTVILYSAHLDGIEFFQEQFGIIVADTYDHIISHLGTKSVITNLESIRKFTVIEANTGIIIDFLIYTNDQSLYNRCSTLLSQMIDNLEITSPELSYMLVET